jgi:ribose transport system permease protein
MKRLLATDWFGLAGIAAAGMVLISVARPEFLSSFNIFVLLDTIALSTLIALSQMIVIGLGQMNLSVGSIGGLVGICFAGAMQVYGVPAWAAAIGGILLGGVAGCFNGWMTAKAGLSAFIVTLATMAAYKGLNMGITQAQPFYDIPAIVKAAGNASILGPIPVLLVPAVVIALGVGYGLRFLPIGRQILAAGGNLHAAELSGISIARVTIVTHLVSGALAGAAGMMAVARLQMGQPTIGDDWLIPSFAAPVIGGAVLSGGHVSVAGTVAGVVIVALITQALVLFRVDPYYVQFLLGALILAAVGANRLRDTRARRGLMKKAA